MSPNFLTGKMYEISAKLNLPLVSTDTDVRSVLQSRPYYALREVFRKSPPLQYPKVAERKEVNFFQIIYYYLKYKDPVHTKTIVAVTALFVFVNESVALYTGEVPTPRVTNPLVILDMDFQCIGQCIFFSWKIWELSGHRLFPAGVLGFLILAELGVQSRKIFCVLPLTQVNQPAWSRLPEDQMNNLSSINFTTFTQLANLKPGRYDQKTGETVPVDH
ncbi:hypothetical protein BDZ97DRAFT_1759835 [Flammula alnicola]|nr:hypothetical protein BDZ97DRAFT_1759835 [Flammula alnicola]